MSASLGDLETQLEQLIETTRQLGIIVSDFQPQGQPVLNQKINDLVTSLQDIDRTKDRIIKSNQDVMVPPEVFDYIDQGRNPTLYTKDCMEKALAENEGIKGKIEGYKKFKSLLHSELNKQFPNEMVKYRSIRGSDDRPS